MAKNECELTHLFVGEKQPARHRFMHQFHHLTSRMTITFNKLDGVIHFIWRGRETALIYMWYRKNHEKTDLVQYFWNGAI